MSEDEVATSFPAAAVSVTSQSSTLIPNHIQAFLDFLLYVVLAGGLSFLGVIANVVNIIVFGKQGLQESSSVSLMALSVTDLGVCLATLLGAVCLSLDKLVTGLSVDVDALFYLFAAWPRVYLAMLSMCTTVVLSVERCLCVIRPLTFKRIINRKTTAIALGILYAEVLSIAAALFSQHRLAWISEALTNTTILKLDRADGPMPLEILLHHTVNNFTLTTVCIGVIMICTAVMAKRLQTASQFRQKSTSQTRSDAVSAKDLRIVKLVTLISAIFLACYLPLMLATVVGTAVPEIDAFGAWVNLNDTLWGSVWSIAACNSAINILVYYRVSSKYKRTFWQLFFRLHADEQRSGTKGTIETN